MGFFNAAMGDGEYRGGGRGQLFIFPFSKKMFGRLVVCMETGGRAFLRCIYPSEGALGY